MGLLWLWLSMGAIGAGLAAYFFRFSVDLSARAQGEPDGSWAAAFGVEIGPLAITAVAAAGVPLTIAGHLFGKSLFRRLAAGKQPPKARRRPAQAEAAAPRALSRRLEGWLDPASAVYRSLRDGTALRVRFVRLDLTYSFRDVALTGRLLGAVYALGALLPRKVAIYQHPRWDFNDRWAADVEGRFIVRPGPLFVRLAWSVIDKGRLRWRRRPELGAAAPRPDRAVLAPATVRDVK